MQRAHAIANGVYVAAVNRVGHEGAADGGHRVLGRVVRERSVRRRAGRGVARPTRRSWSSSATAPTRRTCAATGPSCATAASTPTRRSRSACSTHERRPGHARGAGLPHAGGVGAARRHLARLAARAQRLAGPGKLEAVRWVYAEIVRHLVARRARPHPGAGRGAPSARRATLLAPRRRRRRPRRLLPHPHRPLLDARLLPALRARDRRRRRRRSSTGASTAGRSTRTTSATPPCRERLARRLRRPLWLPTTGADGTRAASCSRAAPSTSTAAARCSPPRSACSARSRPATPACRARELERVLARPPRRPQGALARRRHRRRRHARPRRRPRALRRPAHRRGRRCATTPRDDNYERLRDNRDRLRDMTDQDDAPLRVVALPMPAPLAFDGQRLPASYANFYIGNAVVLVPTFNDPRRPPRARRPRRAVPHPARGRHPRRRSGARARHAPLHDAAGAGARPRTLRTPAAAGRSRRRSPARRQRDAGPVRIGLLPLVEVGAVARCRS